MEIHLDRPHDGLLVGRAEMLSGWLAQAPRDAEIVASCGGKPLLVRPCFHPVMLERPDAQGFWGYLFTQEHLDATCAGRLGIELRAGARPLGALSLRLTPSARVLATEHPLDLAAYAVPRDANARTAPAPAVVFPGLGGVGGATLNELLRVAMLRAGGDVPVHFEADQPALWRRVRTTYPLAYRWIDGHGCYAAGDTLATPSARVTLLREPATRLLSVFDYGTLVHPERFASTGFDDFLRSPAALRATQAVGLLHLAGIADAESLPSDELLARASVELDRSYALVGVTELFAETILLLARLAGLATIGMWWRVLAAPRSVTLDALPARTRDRLEALVAVDRVLHARARERLVARVAEAGLGAALERYATAGARERPLSDVLKQLECLRWRQVLGEPAPSAALTTAPGARAHA